MKILLFNGSPNSNGCTNAALEHMASVLEERGFDTEIFQVGKKIKGGCMACGGCSKTGRCVQNDCVNEAAELLKEADGFVFGTPAHFASPTGDMVSFLDRLFYVGSEDMKYKPAAIAVVARRGGCTAAFDTMMKYPTYNQMPVVSGDYWPIAHAHVNPSQLKEDEEGLFTLSTVARNLAWMVKCIDAGKNAGIEPEHKEKEIWTNFVR